MGGTIDLDPSGRFYLDLKSGNMEMHLVAEGLRKLGTFARLIATGSLLDKGYLFWDEPEAVSYTHLDVYKRQMLSNSRVGRNIGRFPTLAVGAVSMVTSVFATVENVNFRFRFDWSNS